MTSSARLNSSPSAAASRGASYTIAIRRYVQEERFMGVRERLDAVYRANHAESKLDPLLRDLQTQSLPDENW